jgi:PAS domain S-box-containing protein
VYQTLLASDGPVQFHPLAEHPLPTATAERLNEQSRLAVTIYPKGDKPYMFAAHQCAYPRVWTAADERLFLMIGHRLTDGLASLRAFRELRESEARYRRIVDTASEGVWLLGPDHMTVLVNARMADLIGYPVEELIGRPLTDFMFKEDEQDHIRKMDARRQGTSEHYERRLRRKDGQTVWTLASATPLFDDDRRFSGSFAMFTDITALKRNNAINASRLHLMQFAATHALDDLLEETLNEAEKLTGSRIGFYHFVEDDQESLTLQNWSTRTKTQFCKAEGKGLHYPISYAGVWVDCIDRRGPVIHNDYASLAHRKGTPEGHAEVIRELVVPVLRGQRIKAILGVGNKPVDYRQQDVETISLLADLAWEIAERKLAEEALRAQQDFIRNILDSVDEGFIVVDAKYRIRSANRAFLNMVDSTEERVVGRCCYEISHRATHPCFESGEACPVRQTFETSTTQFVTHLHRHASGTKQYVELKAYPITDASGAVVSVIETLNDVTEKRKLEEQLIQSRKMESVGRLAGGVAHDFNNMLGVITGHTELALGQVEPDNPLFAHLQEIFNAARRSADLTRQLLAFARKQVVAPKVLDLNRTVEGMLKMLRRLIGENIALAWLPGPDVWPVKVDPAQIDQILVNLCVNARDAVAGAGKITIETGNSAFDDAYCVDHPGFMPGDFLLLAVSDDGLGMEVKTLDKIFEPFFTTKARGKGTGLGLATVYGIVKQNAGFINVYSEPEHGTTFRIYLPRHATEAEQPVKISPAPPLMQGSETILLVEDEPAILDLTQLMLKRLGYRVLTASTPGDALRIARQYDGDIHLLITDVVMPGMNGWQLAKNLLSLYPEVRYLFMSGYTGNVIAHHGVLDEGVNFIQKPFSLQRLAATVRQALDGK